MSSASEIRGGTYFEKFGPWLFGMTHKWIWIWIWYPVCDPIGYPVDENARIHKKLLRTKTWSGLKREISKIVPRLISRFRSLLAPHRLNKILQSNMWGCLKFLGAGKHWFSLGNICFSKPWGWKTLVFLRKYLFFWALKMENIGFPSEILIFRCPDAGKPGLQAAGMLQTASYMSQATGCKVHATKLRQHSPNSSNLHQNSSQHLPTPPTSTKLPRLRQTPRNYTSDWTLTGYWLDTDWTLTGHWLDTDWTLTGHWLDIDWTLTRR